MILRTAIDSISRGLVFYPPACTYKLEAVRNGSNDLCVRPLARGYPSVPSTIAHILTTPGKYGSAQARLVVVFVPAPSATSKTILHSHGNAVDLGGMLPIYELLARGLNCNIVGWDYRGYGCSSGVPSVSSMCKDLQLVLEDLRQSRGIELSDIVLYGQSVGSGPTCHLAASKIARGVAGVVLHSPFLSGIRVLNPAWTWWPSWADVLPNYKAVAQIKAPTFIVHGVADDVIPISHAQALTELCPAAVQPLWVEKADHDNVELSPLYLPRLKQFLNDACWGKPRL